MKLGGPYMPIAFNRYSISPPGPAGRHQLLGARVRSQAPSVHVEHDQPLSADAPGPAARRQLAQFRAARRSPPLRRSRPESAVRADAVGRAGRRQYGHGRHRLSQDARRLRHAASGSPGHGPPQFRRRHPDRERAHLRRRHGRFQVPRLCDGDRRQAVGDQAAVIDSRPRPSRTWAPMDGSSSPW